MMIYLIAQHPEVEKKVREEVDRLMKEDDYSFENLKKFEYIDMIQKETTRYYGPAPTILRREAIKDNILGGVPIKKGTYFCVFHQATNFNPKYFSNPHEFRPERWASECDNLPPYAFGGFSGGGRTCIGKHLALLEAKIGLIKFLKRYSQIILPKKNFRM